MQLLCSLLINKISLFNNCLVICSQSNGSSSRYQLQQTMASIGKPWILLITTVLAMGAYIVNTWYSWQMFRYNLNVVPGMQDNWFLGSSAFIVLMNIVSNIFNPIVCAGYIMAFYLLSHRRFQILVFLIWFIFLSVFLTFMKSLIQQARPYWIPDAQVQMREWTCYTEFGCPSGHSMLGLILIQFMVRYFSRSRKLKMLPKTIMFLGGAFLQFLVVFSRIILGMHSINQVLFGVMLGFYSLIPYYMYMQKIILKICLKACTKSYRRPNLIVNTFMILVMIGLSMATTFGPQFPNNQLYWNHIQTFQKCQGVHQYSSFQYKCLIDSSLVMAVFGIMYGIVFLRNQQRLMKVVTYPRSSKKYILRLILSALLALIPVAIFLNPFWKNIDLPDDRMAVLMFFLQGAGLMTGNFVLVGLAPAILSKLKLQDYFTLDEGKKYLSYSPLNIQQSTITTKQNEMQGKQKLLNQYSNVQSLYVPQSPN